MRWTTALLLLGASLGPGAAALDTTETTPVTWGIGPATADGPDERVSFRLELEPGSEHSDHLAVTNYSERAVSFELTASDGVVSEAGDFGLLPDTEEPADAGAWIEVPEEVTVPAGESSVVPVTISVPEDALLGDHPAGVAATLAATLAGAGASGWTPASACVSTSGSPARSSRASS